MRNGRAVSATPPTTRMPGDDELQRATARANPRTVFTGSCDFSKRMEASVRSFRAEDVFLTLAGWKHALSKTMRLVDALMALAAPPITPAKAIAPLSSAMTRFDGFSS